MSTVFSVAKMLQKILDDLTKRYGDRLFLEPADLVAIIGMSEGQQANLRSQNKFPIPYTKMGNKIKITIYALAEYLYNSSQIIVKNTIKEEEKEIKYIRKEKKSRKGHLEKNWWASFSINLYRVIDKNLLDAVIDLKEVKVSKIIKV